MIVIIGDFHLKHQEPYWSGQKLLLNYIKEKYAGCTLIFTGDLFDSSSPKWDIFNHFVKFSQEFKGEIHIIHGNHEFYVLKGSVLSALEEISNVKIYSTKTEVKLENEQFLFLPFQYSLPLMQAYEDIDERFDWVVTHITPPKHQFANEGIQLKLKAKAVFHGHIHVSEEYTDDEGIFNVLVGVPQTTRNLEQEFKKRVILIENGSWRSEDLPVYMEIEDIEFGNFPENKLNLLNIKNAPSKKLVETTYAEYHWRKAGITYLDAESNLPMEHLKIENSLEKRFIAFAATNDVDIPKSVQETCLKYFAAVG